MKLMRMAVIWHI